MMPCLETLEFPSGVKLLVSGDKSCGRPLIGQIHWHWGVKKRAFL